MRHGSVTLRRPVLAFASLLVGLGLQAQALTLPTATPLRAYDKGFREPVRLATDSEGRLFVSDARLGLITVRDERGHLLAVKRGLARPLGVAVEASGRIYVAEADRGRVSIFTPGWVPSGALGQGDGEFQMPNHLQITPDGRIWVTDSTASLVKVYSPEGQLVRSFGGPGRLDGQLTFPTGLAVTPGGEVFVSDQGNERIQVFDTNGAFLRKFGGPIGMLGNNTSYGRVQGLLADAQGRLFLADSFRGVITVLTPTGTSLGSLGTFGTDPGQLMGSASLAVDRNNRLFVATPGNTRVQIYGLDSYTDPHLLSADLTVNPTDLRRDAGLDLDEGPRPRRPEAPGPVRGNAPALRRPVNQVSVLIKIPGLSPAAIQDGSLTANGIPATRMPGAYIGDFDGDGNFEFRAWFDRARLLATLPDGEAFLVVAGRLTDGRPFESIAEVRVLASTGASR